MPIVNRSTTAVGRRSRAVAVVAIGLVLAAACSQASPSRVDGAAQTKSVDLTARTADRGATGGSASAAPAPTTVPGRPLDAPRSVISTATLRVRVGDRGVAEDRAKLVATKAGGEVFSEEADLQGEGDTTLTLKVPPARFEAVLSALAKLGTPLDRHRSVEDVTGQVVDLQARLKSARASADRLRVLLAQAPDVEGVVAVESELTTRESEVESLEGQIRVISAQVDLATIELQLTERGQPKVDRNIPGFLQGFRRGWVSFRNALGGALTAIGFLVPFLAVVVPLGLLVRWRRRRTRRRALPTGPAGGASGPTGIDPNGPNGPSGPSAAREPVGAGYSG